jgi:lipoyl(octanoyl) transferase
MFVMNESNPIAARRSAILVDIGKMDYNECWSLQHVVHSARVKENLPDCLLMVEHSHVVTMGKKSNRENILAPEFLREMGIACIPIERGGDVTYHGPGQLMCYPIFALTRKGRKMGIGEFVSFLEEVMIRTLHEFGIKGERNTLNRGVWVGMAKIGFVGIAVKKHVSLHGFALNVAPDLSFFKMIHSCGLKDVSITSMRELLDRPVAIKEVRRHIIFHFQDIFGLSFDEVARDLFFTKISRISPWALSDFQQFHGILA